MLPQHSHFPLKFMDLFDKFPMKCSWNWSAENNPQRGLRDPLWVVNNQHTHTLSTIIHQLCSLGTNVHELLREHIFYTAQWQRDSVACIRRHSFLAVPYIICWQCKWIFLLLFYCLLIYHSILLSFSTVKHLHSTHTPFLSILHYQH